MSPESFHCRYCKKSNVSRSLKGLKSHIAQSPECRIRRDQERRLLKNQDVQTDSPRTSLPPVGQHAWEENTEDENTPPSSSANVDDDEDDDAGDQDFQPTGVSFIVDYPVEACPGAVFDDQSDGLEARFEKIQRKQREAGKQPWEPFSSLADWELSRWLIQSGVSQREIDKFLKLESICTRICYDDSLTESLLDSVRRLPISKQ
jgi:hypothetical protein